MIWSIAKWISSSLPEFVVLVGVVALFNAVILTLDARKLKFSPREKAHFPSIYAGLTIVLIGLLLLIVRFRASIDNSVPLPNFAGSWEYSVFDETGSVLTHKGDCVIVQKGRTLRFNGTRKFTRDSSKTPFQYKSVNIHWDSTWAELTDDAKIRCEYQITLATREQILAYFVLSPSEGELTTMEGKYWTLPPIPLHLPNPDHGNVKFRRLKAGEAIVAPGR